MLRGVAGHGRPPGPAGCQARTQWVVGWFFIFSGNFGAFSTSGGSLYTAIELAAGIALFSFIGVETAAITARRVRDPGRNVGCASVIGTVASALVYLLVSAAVTGLVPHHALAGNGAPFVNAFETIFSHGAWAGKLVAPRPRSPVPAR